MNDLAFVKNLRIGFLVCWVLAWNALLGLGMWLDGSMEGGSTFSTFFSVAAICTSLLCLVVIFSPSVQTFVIRPTSHIGLIRKQLWFTCILTGLLGAIALVGVVSK